MSKTLRKKNTNLIGIIQQHFILLKKQLQSLLKSTRPYLATRYWMIYVAAFGLGFYLWGPAHGLTKVKNWEIFRTAQTDQTMTLETLQREIELLKKEISKNKIREEESAVKFSPNRFSRPAIGEIVQGFEWHKAGDTWRLHSGIDIETLQGSSIMASAEGVVQEITSAPGEGLTVILEHGNDWESIYGNLDEVVVKKGDRIIKGMIIGISGTKSCNQTNPGFHFGINHDQKPVNPENIIKGLTE